MSVQVKFTAAVGSPAMVSAPLGSWARASPPDIKKMASPHTARSETLPFPTANELEHAGTPLQLRWL